MHDECLSLIWCAEWPQYSASSDVWMQLTVPACAPMTDVNAANCDFWDQLGYNIGSA